jgi:hypothetical protein
MKKSVKNFRNDVTRKSAKQKWESDERLQWRRAKPTL